jgi:hypothetical protein
MPRTIEFTYDDCEFENAAGIMMSGPYFSLEIESDGETFKIESVRSLGFPLLKRPGGAVPAFVSDYFNAWLADDLAKPGDKSLIRSAYDAEMARQDDFAAGQWADHLRDERRMTRAA